MMEKKEKTEIEKATESHYDKYKSAIIIITVVSVVLAYIAIPFTEESVFLAFIFFIVCQLGAYYIYKSSHPEKDK